MCVEMFNSSSDTVKNRKHLFNGEELVCVVLERAVRLGHYIRRLFRIFESTKVDDLDHIGMWWKFRNRSDLTIEACPAFGI